MSRNWDAVTSARCRWGGCWALFAMMLSTDAAASQTRQKSATNFSVSSSNTPHTVAPVRRPPLFNLGAGAVGATRPLGAHCHRQCTSDSASQRMCFQAWCSCVIGRLGHCSRLMSVCVCVWESGERDADSEQIDFFAIVSSFISDPMCVFNLLQCIHASSRISVCRGKAYVCVFSFPACSSPSLSVSAWGFTDLIRTHTLITFPTPPPASGD